jgi:hypothetical protein
MSYDNILIPEEIPLKFRDANGKRGVSEYVIDHVKEDGELVVRDTDTDKLELWGKTDVSNNSYVLIYNEEPYEFITSRVEPLQNEITATGNVAGYSTPYAFSKRGDGNKSAAETAGYKLIKKEVSDHNLLETKYNNYKNYPSKGSTKASLSLREINSMLRSAARLLNYNLKLKNEGGLDGHFWKRSSNDVAAILENIKSISKGIKMLTKGRLNEVQAARPAAEPSPQPAVPPASPDQNFAISIEFNAFEKSLAKLITKFESILESKVAGRLVRLRASKGYGQVEKEYEFTTASVSIVLFKEKYNIIFRGTNRKEYYVNPAFNVKILGGGQQDVTPPQAETVPAPVSTDLNPPKTVKKITK